jgi:hypothetical protein
METNSRNKERGVFNWKTGIAAVSERDTAL